MRSNGGQEAPPHRQGTLGQPRNLAFGSREGGESAGDVEKVSPRKTTSAVAVDTYTIAWYLANDRR